MDITDSGLILESTENPVWLDQTHVEKQVVLSVFDWKRLHALTWREWSLQEQKMEQDLLFIAHMSMLLGKCPKS